MYLNIEPIQSFKIEMLTPLEVSMATMRLLMEKQDIDIKSLKRAYKRAVKNDKETFKYDGVEYLTLYAKYLIQFIEGI